MHIGTLTIVGVGRQSASLERARARGAIDEACPDLPEAVSRADLAVFCTPVTLIADQVLAAAPRCAAGTLLTDAGSTKRAIVAALDGRLPHGVAFVGSHPLAGSEKRGPEHADADLFQDRVTVVTPTPASDPAAVARTIAFWRALGSRVICMDPEQHDRALAVTSHLPHLLASALAGILPPDLHALTANGFRDTTRIAAGDPGLWTGILMQNRAALLDALGKLLNQVGEFQKALTHGDRDAIADLLARGKRSRDALGN